QDGISVARRELKLTTAPRVHRDEIAIVRRNTNDQFIDERHSVRVLTLDDIHAPLELEVRSRESFSGRRVCCTFERPTCRRRGCKRHCVQGTYGKRTAQRTTAGLRGDTHVSDRDS